MTRFTQMIGRLTEDETKDLLAELVPQMQISTVTEVLVDVLSDNEKEELVDALGGVMEA